MANSTKPLLNGTGMAMTVTKATTPGRNARFGAAGQAGADLNGLLAEPRRMKILAWLQEEGSARVRDLSAAFAVS